MHYVIETRQKKRHCKRIYNIALLIMFDIYIFMKDIYKYIFICVCKRSGQVGGGELPPPLQNLKRRPCAPRPPCVAER